MKRFLEKRQVLCPAKAGLRADGCGSSAWSSLLTTLLVLVFAAATIAVFMTGSAAAAASTEINKKRGDLQVPFIRNLGQTDQQVKFYAKTLGGATYITRKGEIVYDLPKVQDKQTVMGWSLKEELIGAQIHSVEGEEKAAATVSSFLGKDPSKWKSDIPTYSLVTMGEVHKGIHLKLRAYGGSVEKLFSVRPGAKPEQIKVKVSGASSLRTNNKGELEVETGLGRVVFTKPKAYQTSAGRTQEVAVAYAVTGKSYGFRVGEYDPKSELIIDPLIRATYLGGSGNEIIGNGLALSDSKVYVAGSTDLLNFPGTSGGAQSAKASSRDAFVALLSSDLGTLIQATYFGGNGADHAAAIAVSGSNIYVAGSTTSTDLPKTATGARPTNAGGDSDGFVALFSADLKTLTRATYLGGTYTDSVVAMAAVSPSGADAYSVFVAGTTTSPDFPKTTGGAKPASTDPLVFDGSLFGDSFVAAFSSDLTTLNQATYIGGSSIDEVHAMAVIPGFVYLTGGTHSRDFPWTAGGALEIRPDPSILERDAFVALLTSDLTTPVQATYLGGAGLDVGWAIAVDSFLGVYVTGETSATDFPGTAGHFQPLNQGYIDGFVAHLSTDLKRLLQSTYLGGSGLDQAFGIAIGSAFDGARIYVTGQTGVVTDPDSFDSFVAALLPNLGPSSSPYIGITRLGGTGHDTGLAIAAENPGITGFNVYVAGSTFSTDFPGTTGIAPPIITSLLQSSQSVGLPGGAQRNYGGGGDAFVAKLVLVPDYAFSPVSPITVSPGGSGCTTVTISSLNGLDQGVKFGLFGAPTGGPVPNGFTASFEPGLGPPPDGSASTPLTINVASFVTLGTYTLWLIAFPGDYVSHVTPVIVNVVSTPPPLAQDLSIVAAGNLDTPVVLKGSDPNGLPLTFSLVTPPSHGNVHVSGTAPNLTYTYTPFHDYLGPDSFKYAASNGTLTSCPATVSITVKHGLLINDVSLTEGNSGTKAFTFTVTMTVPSTSGSDLVTFSFRTADGTAKAGSDYLATSGTITIPLGVTAQPVVIPVIGDRTLEFNETFLVQLINNQTTRPASPTLNAVIVRGTGRGTIVDDEGLVSRTVGTAALIPEHSVVSVGQPVDLSLAWTHPVGWRKLNSVDLLLVDDEGEALAVRWHEAENSFSLFNPAAERFVRTAEAGSPARLETSEATLYLQESSGGGPPGQTVTIDFNLSFKPQAAGRTFSVEAFAIDDEGNEQGFESVGTITVLPR